MKDIETRTDIEHLVQLFYQKALTDEVIGHFFTEVIALDLAIHLPHICDFWEAVLLGNMVYKGNPMLKHIAIHQKEKLSEQHFERWLSLWESVVKDNFEGTKANEAIERANTMGKLMLYKIEQSEQQGFIQ